MGKMKVKEEHVAALRGAMAPFLNRTTAEVYRDAGLSPKRYVWDAFWSACKHTPGLNDVVREVYTYANDDHLHTVFCHLAKERENVEVGEVVTVRLP